MTKSSRKRSQLRKKIKRRRLYGFFIHIILIVLLAFAASMVMQNRMSYWLGFRGYITLSDSMAPVIQKGSLLITQRVDPEAIRKGDIITYKENAEIMTQRVVDIQNQNGGLSFVTKGDANEGVNSLAVQPENIIGRFVYSVNFAGSAILALRSPLALSVCVAGSCAFIIIMDTANKRVKKYLHRKKRQKRHNPRNQYIISPA